ncbi:hypothetical protein B0H11DRAFT_2260558 [Mycena galericulata]|nr:hypothetical protein B0H11DRAFT_2260558 [Mycena galericulata]
MLDDELSSVASVLSTNNLNMVIGFIVATFCIFIAWFAKENCYTLIDGLSHAVDGYNALDSAWEAIYEKYDKAGTDEEMVQAKREIDLAVTELKKKVSDLKKLNRWEKLAKRYSGTFVVLAYEEHKKRLELVHKVFVFNANRRGTHFPPPPGPTESPFLRVSRRMQSSDRITLSPLFQTYQWRSRGIIENTWIDDEPIQGFEEFFETLKLLDTTPFLPKSSDELAMFRAHLGLPNVFNYQITENTSYQTKAASVCWITLLRFQALDLLISLANGSSSVPSPGKPAPKYKAALSLLNALTKWPTSLASVQKTYQKPQPSAPVVQNTACPPKSKSIQSVLALVSTKWGNTIAGKASRNLQAMGAALQWIIECKASPWDITGNMKVADSYVGLSEEEKLALGSLSVAELLRPLSYALNSSPVLAFCNFDLGKNHGHMLSQYQTRAFLGRRRPPKLAHVENAILATIQGVSAGVPLVAALQGRLIPALLCMPPQGLDDTGIFIVPPRAATIPAPLPQTPKAQEEKRVDSGSPKPRDGDEVNRVDVAIELMVLLKDASAMSAQTYVLQEENELHEGEAVSGGPERSTEADEFDVQRPVTWPDGEYVDMVVNSKKRKIGRGRGSNTRKKRKIIDTNPEDLSEIEKHPPERCKTPVILEAYRPDGFSKRTFALLLHTISEHVERPMLLGLQRSMDAVDARCVRNGRRFRHHAPGSIPTMRPAHDEFDLYVIQGNHWENMPGRDRVAIWKTGCDIFVRDMKVVKQRADIVERITSLHRLEEPIQVQVPGLRIPAADDADEDAANNAGEDVDVAADYTQCIRTTTLRNFLKHASLPHGVVLNALKLPETHTPQPNPLAGSLERCSGLDLEDIAYRQTNGLSGFPTECVPAEQQFWQIAGTAHTLTIGHLDMSATRITVEGPGEKLWIRKRRTEPQNIEDTYAFHTWDPDRPDFTAGDHEGVVLPPHGGTLLMQATREHIVVGMTPVSAHPAEPKVDVDGDTRHAANNSVETEGVESELVTPKLMATVVTGGHFMVASTIRSSLCTLLHLVMMENILTNVEHDGLWKIFVRISAFWMSITRDRPQDCKTLEIYIPQLSTTTTDGWMDIIYVACVVVLGTPFDRRHYTQIVPSELDQRQQAITMYKLWRQWFAETFIGTRGGAPPVLMHMAIMLTLYHRREINPHGSDVLLRRGTKDLSLEVSKTLNAYKKKMGTSFLKEIKKPETEHANARFFLFEGPEFEIQQRPHRILACGDLGGLLSRVRRSRRAEGIVVSRRSIGSHLAASLREQIVPLPRYRIYSTLKTLWCKRILRNLAMIESDHLSRAEGSLPTSADRTSASVPHLLDSQDDLVETDIADFSLRAATSSACCRAPDEVVVSLGVPTGFLYKTCTETTLPIRSHNSPKLLRRQSNLHEVHTQR